MDTPGHFDLAAMEKSVREHAAQSFATARRERAGKDCRAIDLQEMLFEVQIVASVRIAQAINEGFEPVEIAHAYGGAIGNAIGTFRLNVDPDGSVGDLFFGTLDRALLAITTGVAGGGEHLSALRVHAEQGGRA